VEWLQAGIAGAAPPPPAAAGAGAAPPRAVVLMAVPTVDGMTDFFSTVAREVQARPPHSVLLYSSFEMKGLVYRAAAGTPAEIPKVVGYELDSTNEKHKDLYGVYHLIDYVDELISSLSEDGFVDKENYKRYHDLVQPFIKKIDCGSELGRIETAVRSLKPVSGYKNVRGIPPADAQHEARKRSVLTTFKTFHAIMGKILKSSASKDVKKFVRDMPPPPGGSSSWDFENIDIALSYLAATKAISDAISPILTNMGVDHLLKILTENPGIQCVAYFTYHSRHDMLLSVLRSKGLDPIVGPPPPPPPAGGRRRRRGLRGKTAARRRKNSSIKTRRRRLF
jgi:hypothetical protein